jgi:hypothetical protein
LADNPPRGTSKKLALKNKSTSNRCWIGTEYFERKGRHIYSRYKNKKFATGLLAEAVDTALFVMLVSKKSKQTTNKWTRTKPSLINDEENSNLASRY